MATNITDAIQVEPFENLGKTISKGVDIELNYFYKNTSISVVISPDLMQDTIINMITMVIY